MEVVSRDWHNGNPEPWGGRGSGVRPINKHFDVKRRPVELAGNRDRGGWSTTDG